jgi:hypothetical protein
VGNTIGNRGLQGGPMLPYANVKSYAGADIFMDMEFVDHTMTPVVPVTLTLEIDDLTNSQIVLGRQNLVVSATPPIVVPTYAAAMTIQFAGSLLPMTFPYEGSQLNQFNFQFTAIDSVTGQLFTGQSIVIVELVSIQTVSGN